jgi:glycosyltransferase involved in cell wall biosynthesis
MAALEPSTIVSDAGTVVDTTSTRVWRPGRSVKSLLISSMYFPPQVGGISHSMAAIASAIGPDRICCLTAVPANKTDNWNGFLPRVYRRPAALGHVKHLHALAWGATISEIIIHEKPQIVQLSNTFEGYLGLWLRQWLHLPFVVYAHGNEILSAIQGNWEKPLLALRRADRVLANSRFTADLVQRAGVEPNRIGIIHLGCDVDRFRPLPPKMELRRRLLGERYKNRVILTVGNLVARKGHDMVIRALPRLRQIIPDVTYLIVGDGPYRQQLTTMAEDMNVKDLVIFAGQIPERELPDVYRLSDVFAMPSRELLDECDVEGFGLVFLEANACAKPVVGGRSGGIPDAVEDGVTGFLADPNDSGDIADAIARLLSDSDLTIRMGRQGRLRVLNNFTWQHVGNRVQGILENLLREKLARR